MTPAPKTLEDLLAEFDAALVWLSSLNVQTDNTRFSRYRAQIARAITEEARGSFQHQRTDAFLNALMEAGDVIEIATLDPRAFLSNAHALRKLRRLSKGADETPTTGFDPARDSGFEFATAAMLNSHGVFGGFGDYGDVLQKPGWHPWECKRLGSLEAIPSRVQEARDQLSEAQARGVSSGIIALDLTRPLRNDHGVLNAKTDSDLLAATQKFLAEIIPKYFFENRLVDDRTRPRPSALGVFLRFVSIGRLGNSESVRSSTTWQMVPLHDPLSVENALFREVAEATGPIIDGDFGALLEAEDCGFRHDPLTDKSLSPLAFAITCRLRQL